MSTPSQQLGRPTRRKSPSSSSSSTSRSSTPWAPQMMGLTGILVLVGLVALIIGSSKVGSEITYDDQVPGINLAIFGTVLANAAGVSFLLAGRRAVSMRRVGVLGALPPVPVQAARTAVAVNEQLVGSDDLRHFHRSDCALAAGRDWPARTRAEHERAGRTPCGVCRP